MYSRDMGRGNGREGGRECTVGTWVGATVGGGGKQVLRLLCRTWGVSAACALRPWPPRPLSPSTLILLTNKEIRPPGRIRGVALTSVAPQGVGALPGGGLLQQPRAVGRARRRRRGLHPHLTVSD